MDKKKINTEDPKPLIIKKQRKVGKSWVFKFYEKYLKDLNTEGLYQ